MCQSAATSVGKSTVLKSLTVEQLTNHLMVKGLSTSGKKGYSFKTKVHCLEIYKQTAPSALTTKIPQISQKFLK
jgi:ribosomal protein S7